MIEVREARKRFSDTFVLDGVTLTIGEGERVALMGPNGAGKTTLVRAILGFYHLDGGRITVDGYTPTEERVRVLERIGFIPQTPPPIKLSLEELMEYVSQSSGVDREAIKREALRMELDIERNLQKPFFKLSGGMKQKLLIAIALAKEGSYLIFDEPTANLDPKAREHFYSLLEELPERVATIFITHRIEEIAGLVNRKVYMDLGKVVEDEYL
ncbi:MAG: ABC transporter ATP-binding protein [Epsilonproteobacteria bacterium]|nr:ABC transporter ATP-binding protein [Campylobacterota bacterium]NPA56367.1 ABC transporter ATP-binding protein [Campylobacterota bacterium]